MLSVGVANHPEELLDALAGALGRPLADPFQAEWVSVPSLGFRSWLRFRLAERLGSTGTGAGIAANIEMPFPGALRWRILDAHNHLRGRPEEVDPWQVERLVWSVLDVMADPSSEIEARLRRNALPTGVTLASRAGPIADLFDRYGVHRPDMVRAWAEGRDVGADGVSGLPPERRWQPGLYRAVRAHIAEHHQGLVPPAERLAEALGMVRSGELDLRPVGAGSTVALPPRLFVVGQSILTAELGPVLRAVAEQCEVVVLLSSPSVEATVRLARLAAHEAPAVGATSWGFSRTEGQEMLEPDTPTAPDHGHHPLVRTWGARPLESALMLGAGGIVPEAITTTTTTTSTTTTTTTPTGPSLLQRIQTDLRADRSPDRSWIGPLPDPSLQVHAAPGHTRQVEALRDVLLGMLRDDPSLRESDIAILCPQLDVYSPVISAVLGPSAERGEQPEPDEVPALRYTVVDRDARSFNPVLAAMAAVVELLPGRFDAAGVRDLLHAPAVRERFGLTTDDLSLLSTWIDDAGIRWGLDGPQRSRWGIDPGHRPNSWAAGADQLMMGIALGDDLRDLVDHPTGPTGEHALAIGSIAPMPLAEGDIASAGRLTAAVRTLAHVHQTLFSPEPAGAGDPDPGSGSTDTFHRTAEQWRQVLTRAADLLVAPARFEEWQRAAFDDALANLLDASADHDGAPSTTPLTFGDVRRLLAPSLEGPRARADLGYGSVVVARPTLVGGVPFRVVCLLGLDEEALPTATIGGDDLMGATAFVGDREPRAEARAEVLTALGAARDHLVITCMSRNVRTNEEVPRSVVLDELLDVVDATVSPDAVLPGEAASAQEAIVRTHPRQAFDLANFTVPDEGAHHPFGFDLAAMHGAAAVAARRAETRKPSTGPLLTTPLAPAPDHGDTVELDQFLRFYDHPVKAFFARLGVTVPKEAEEGDLHLPTALGNLEAWGVGSALLRIGMGLDSPEQVHIEPTTVVHPAVADVVASFRARGILPPDAAAEPALAEISEQVAGILREASRLGVHCEAAAANPVDVVLPSGIRLRGVATDCAEGTLPGPVHVQYSKFKPRHQVAMSITLLALTAHQPDRAWRGVLITRDARKAKAIARAVRGDTPEDRRDRSLRALDVLVAQYREGLCYPLPLFDGTSHAEATGEQKPTKPWGPLQKSERSYAHECQDAYHQLAFGKLTFDDLQRSEFGGYRFATEARRLWETVEGALCDAGDDVHVAAPAGSVAGR